MTISSIIPHLTHLVDIVNVTLTEGVRTTSTQSNVACRIQERKITFKDALGNHLATETIVFFAPDAVINNGDELIIDGLQRPIKKIWPARDRNAVHHLEVSVT